MTGAEIACVQHEKSVLYGILIASLWREMNGRSTLMSIERNVQKIEENVNESAKRSAMKDVMSEKLPII